jgi:hypothetical protein
VEAGLLGGRPDWGIGPPRSTGVRKGLNGADAQITTRDPIGNGDSTVACTPYSDDQGGGGHHREGGDVNGCGRLVYSGQLYGVEQCVEDEDRPDTACVGVDGGEQTPGEGETYLQERGEGSLVAGDEVDRVPEPEDDGRQDPGLCPAVWQEHSQDDASEECLLDECDENSEREPPGHGVPMPRADVPGCDGQNEDDGAGGDLGVATGPWAPVAQFTPLVGSPGPDGEGDGDGDEGLWEYDCIRNTLVLYSGIAE